MADKIILPGSKARVDPLPPVSITEPRGAKLTPAPASVRPPEDVAAAQKVFDDSVVALETAKAGRNVLSIPLSDSYWGALHQHNVAYTALKDSILEIPLSSPPDSDMLHDLIVARDAIMRGDSRATAMSQALTGTIKIPVENVPDEFRPFIRASIPSGVKLETAAPQVIEEAVLEIPLPTPPPVEEIPPPPATLLASK